ncbi:DMT family transporter [Rubrolithibacter danxiaensis]|uniref:DMT family transporter n=1 Tax=Rubrolithibacter danxiaensis TaxID=3390805 RepID=UPI003BF88C63
MLSKKFSGISRNVLVLHATVFVWGFTGILGALISVSAIPLVWYRVLIAFVALYCYFKATKTSIRINTEAFLKLFFTGGLVALHWILFFHSIKISTVSVTLVCLSSLTLFTAFLEPLIYRQKIAMLEVITGLLIIAGIGLIFKFESRYTAGIITGLISSFCASLFSIINSKQVKNRPAPIIAFYELAGASVWVSLYLLVTGGYNSSLILPIKDIFYLLVLGVICTSLAYVAGVSVMKELTAFRVALITNLEPVYGIILAFIFLGKKEQMTGGFYGGACLILGVIFLYPYVKNKIEKRKLNKLIPIG